MKKEREYKIVKGKYGEGERRMKQEGYWRKEKLVRILSFATTSSRGN